MMSWDIFHYVFLMILHMECHGLIVFPLVVFWTKEYCIKPIMTTNDLLFWAKGYCCASGQAESCSLTS